MNYKAMFKGEYISAVEFGEKQPTMKIAGVKLCKLEQEDGRHKDKGIISFEGIERGWVINRTNAECLAAMWGPETDKWIGKRVTLFAMPVRVGAKTEPGIRVKGSPDIEQPITIQIKLPRKKPQPWKLVPTTARTQAATEAPPEPESTDTVAESAADF